MSVEYFNEKPQQYQGFSAFGNKCGHKKDDFRDITFNNEKNRPKVIQWAMERIRKFFTTPDKYFPDLKSLNTPKKDGGERLTRSEGRESMMLLSLLLFYNLELSTMTIRSDDIVFNSLTLAEITNDGDLLSMSRAYRALAKLVKTRWVTVTKQYEKADNLYCALASIKEITPAFFKALGLEKYYSFSQAYKRKILEKRPHKKSKKQQAAQRFDAYLPSRDVVFKKVSDNKIEIVTHADIEKMRKELLMLCAEQSPTVSRALLEAVVYKYDYNNLKSNLVYHRSLKARASPS